MVIHDYVGIHVYIYRIAGLASTLATLTDTQLAVEFQPASITSIPAGFYSIWSRPYEVQ